MSTLTDLSAANNFGPPSASSGRGIPTFQANIKNSLPGLYFDGTVGQLLRALAGEPIIAAMQNATNFTMLAVSTPTVADGVVAHTVLSAQQSTASTNLGRIQPAMIRADRTGRAQRSAGTSVIATTVNTITAGQVARMVTRYDGATLKTIMNGGTEASIASTATLSGFDICYLGGEQRGTSTLTNFLIGHIHELRIWLSLADDTARDALLAYGATKWGS